MRVSYLKLQNYRCFDEIEMSLNPELTVIVGANGAGKSALLDGLTVALGPYLSKFDEGKGAGFSKQDARRVRSHSNEFQMEPQFPVRIEAIGHWDSLNGVSSVNADPDQLGLFTESNIDLYETPSALLAKSWEKPLARMQRDVRYQSWGQESFYWRRELTGPKNKTTFADAWYLEEFGKAAQIIARRGEEVVLPVLGYYGTGRLWLQQKLTESKKALLTESRTTAYRDCLTPSSSYKEFAYWFKQLHESITAAIDLASMGITTKHLPKLKELRSAIVEAVDICLAQSSWAGIYYDSLEKQIQVRGVGEVAMPVSQLSDGIRNVLALAADIAFRCCQLNGFLGAQAVKQSTGIVMIDELDLHLHPSWQQTIVPSFQKAFPKIQFILTTHSPHLLSAVPAECVRILQDRQILHPTIETEGEQSQAVLESVFGVPAWPPIPIVDVLKRYQQLVEVGEYDSEEAHVLRNHLDTHYGKHHAELVAADLLRIRLEAINQSTDQKIFKKRS